MASDLPKNGSKSLKVSDSDAALKQKVADTFYFDPELGLWVTTREAHLKRGYCCGNGCRHCPYDHENVR